MSIRDYFGEEVTERVDEQQEAGFDKEAWIMQKQVERDAIQATVRDQLVQIRDDADWREAYLDLAGRMGRKYSTRNLILISAQCPEAVKLAAFEDWTQKGYRINKGERAVVIYEPAEIRNEDGSSKTVFNVRKVYDVSQTNAVKREQTPLPFTRGQILDAISDSSPYKVIVTDGMEKLVETNKAGQEIRIRKGASPREIFGPLLREVLRARLEVDGQIEAGPKSVFVASAGAYILGRRYRLEMDISDFAALRMPPDEVKALDGPSFEKLLDTANKSSNRLSRHMSRSLGEDEREKGDKEPALAIRRLSPPKKSQERGEKS